MSLALFGNNSFKEELRVMTSLELHLNADYYCKHPIFVLMATSKYFLSMESVLKVCVSEASFISNASSINLVKLEALKNCHEKTWSSFLCILTLASVIENPIQSLYPDFGLDS